MEETWKKKIMVVWTGQSVSLLSSSILQMCLIWYLTKRTESATVITLATLAGFLPQALAGPFVGAVVDRFSKKLVIICADLFVASMSLVLAYVASLGEIPVPVILVILVFRSLGTAFHEPTVQTITPLLVPEAYLTRYAGHYQAFETVSLLLAPSISVVLYELWSLEFIILLDVFGALFAVVLFLFIKLPEEPKTQREKMNFIKETKEGLAVMRDIPGIYALLWTGFLYTAIYSPIGSLYPHITMVYFGGSTAQSALVEVVFSCGTMLGALLLGKVGDKLPKHLGLFGSIFLYGLGSAVVGSLPSSGFLIFVVISFFIGTTTPFFHGVTRAIYQMRIPPEYLGRAFAMSVSARRLGMPIGLVLGGQFGDLFGVNVLYQVAGTAAVVLALVGPHFSGMKENA